MQILCPQVKFILLPLNQKVSYYGVLEYLFDKPSHEWSYGIYTDKMNVLSQSVSTVVGY